MTRIDRGRAPVSAMRARVRSRAAAAHGGTDSSGCVAAGHLTDLRMQTPVEMGQFEIHVVVAHARPNGRVSGQSIRALPVHWIRVDLNVFGYRSTFAKHVRLDNRIRYG